MHQPHERLLFLGTDEDQPYLSYLKGATGSASCKVSLLPATLWTPVKMLCEKNAITGIICTQLTLLQKLVGAEKGVSIDNYAGSLFVRDGIEIVFVHPLTQIHTVAHSKFLLKHYISKLVAPQQWYPRTAFSWQQLLPENFDGDFWYLANCEAIAVDIETTQDPLRITEIGYTGIYWDQVGKQYTTQTFVLEVSDLTAVAMMRQINALPVPKILQNGKYDIAYLARYDAQISHYFWDTATMFHCIYSELPKDLASLGAFYVRDAMYWKDMAASGDKQDALRYNALDTWTTANVFLAWMHSAPEYARQNYLQEFPLLAACHLCEMTGIQRDMSRLSLLNQQLQDKEKALHTDLQVMVATPNFNPGSYKQVLGILKALGCADITSSDEKNLMKAAFRHPVIARIVEQILEIRGTRKLLSTYLTAGKEFGSKPTILYSLNPHGTDTGRLASKEHHFWCGLQIQNIPRGPEVKSTLTVPEGWLLGEVDLEQAESRDTAHISGDENLIAAVSGTRDFHSVNASAFFGYPYESIYDDSIGKTTNKPLRDLAKRVNHGANYNMGPNVLVDTMGLTAIYKAAALLKLTKGLSPKQIAEELLARFHKTYPAVAGVMYKGIVVDVSLRKTLVGATGWTRYCFKDPKNDKRAMNAYAAHPAQSLNAMMLNKAFLKVFYEIALHPDHGQNFRLLAQIHDSILFRFREGHEYLCALVKQAMEIPVTVTGYDGKTRTFTVPAAIKAGKNGKGAKYWSETE